MERQGRLQPFSTCSRCLSACTAAFTCSVFDPLIVGGGSPQGLALQPHLLEAVCLSRAEKTGKALCHNAFPVLLAHSLSITGLRLLLYVVSQEQLTAFALGAGLFSAQHPPLKAGWDWLSWRSEDMPKCTAYRRYQHVGIVQPLRRSQILWIAFTGAFMQDFFQFPQKTVGSLGEYLIPLPDDRCFSLHFR